ncbi:MAG TPA: HAD family hydrolase [Candidatus Dormibacteraeota bacterium]|jgi:D-glycero-D-manno-heptose 1,7-bisphosphate phosphatase
MGAPRRQLRPAVFLDRDGVLNRAEVVEGTPHPPGSVDEVKIIASAVDACRRLREAGYVLVVVTNQPDVARGTETMEGVGAINGAVGDVIEIDEFVVCPHDDQDGCACRKPKPGMLTAAAERRGLDLGRSFMVGDRWRDIEAGRRAGCTTVFVDRGYTERRPSNPDLVVGELAEAVPRIVAVHVTEQEGSNSHA